MVPYVNKKNESITKPCTQLHPAPSTSTHFKIGTHGISRMLIFIPTLVFWISNKNPFLGKFGPKKSDLSIQPEQWHTWYLEDVDSYSEISFLNFKT